MSQCHLFRWRNNHKWHLIKPYAIKMVVDVLHARRSFTHQREITVGRFCLVSGGIMPDQLFSFQVELNLNIYTLYRKNIGYNVLNKCD